MQATSRTILRLRRAIHGLCIDCGDPADGGRTRCRYHADKNRRYQVTLRARRDFQQRCPRCGAPRLDDGRHCPNCNNSQYRLRRNHADH